MEQNAKQDTTNSAFNAFHAHFRRKGIVARGNNSHLIIIPEIHTLLQKFRLTCKDLHNDQVDITEQILKLKDSSFQSFIGQSNDENKNIENVFINVFNNAMDLIKEILNEKIYNILQTILREIDIFEAESTQIFQKLIADAIQSTNLQELQDEILLLKETTDKKLNIIKELENRIINLENTNGGDAILCTKLRQDLKNKEEENEIIKKKNKILSHEAKSNSLDLETAIFELDKIKTHAILDTTIYQKEIKQLLVMIHMRNDEFVHIKNEYDKKRNKDSSNFHINNNTIVKYDPYSLKSIIYKHPNETNNKSIYTISNKSNISRIPSKVIPKSVSPRKSKNKDLSFSKNHKTNPAIDKKIVDTTILLPKRLIERPFIEKR